jgi:hypothetical protein
VLIFLQDYEQPPGHSTSNPSADFPGLDKFPGKEQNFYRRMKSETTLDSLRGLSRLDVP